MDRENATLLQRQAMNRSSFYMLLFLFSLLFLNFSDDEASRRGKPTIDGLLESLEHEKELLGNVTFGVNITHPRPPEVETQLQELDSIARSSAHYYHNITGVFRGNWKSQNVTVLSDDETANNRTLQDEARGSFRFDDGGSFTLNINSMATKDENIHYVEAHMRLKDAEKSDYGALLLAEGIHILDKGALYLIGVPNRAIYPSEELLHMLPDNETMIQARNVLYEQIDKQMDDLKQLAASGGQYIDDHEHPLSVEYSCAFQIFAQLSPVPKDVKLVQLLEYEKELENPQGISTIKPPPLSMANVMYSPNCGLSLSYEDAPGIKIEKYYSKAVTYAAFACILAIIQILSLISQMEYTPTPSSVSNVSSWTIVMQAMMDGYLSLLHLTTGVVVEPVFRPFSAGAFFSFVLVSVFSMRYLLVIWRIQRPESSRPATTNNANQQGQQQQQQQQQQQRTILPLANPPRPAVATTSDAPPDFGLLYYRLYALLLIGLFLFYQTTTRSAFVQNVIIGILGFAFYSFWIPQIVRNVMRGCRRPLSRRYILGMTFTRLAIPLYFYGCPHNLISHEQSPWVWVLVGYVVLQAFILLLQDRLGPRFFIPEKYLPQTYNYHPILSRDDEETGQGNPRDCAICMLPVDTSSTGPPGLNMLNRAQYMLTPCQHLFHTDCLEQWMRIKLECPVCRSYLPVC